MSAWPHVVTLDPHSAGLAVARCMTHAGARVTMIVAPGHSREAHSRGVESVCVDYGDDGEGWLEALLQIAASGEDVVVLPATDRGSDLLMREGDRLPPNVRSFERQGSGHRALMDKDTADEIARRAGVAVPWTARVRDGAELAAAIADAPWPCVVKPIYSHEWRARYGEARAFLAHDADEARSLLERPLRDGIGMLLCEYIPGGDDDVEEAIVVRLADGSYPVRFGCRKLRQHPCGFGATALGESSPLPETMALATRVLDEAGFVGVAGVETKRHPDTDERWFLEVNVRIPGQWGLGDASGVDATPRLVAALCGRELEPSRPMRPDVRIVVPSLDVQVLRELLPTVPAWRRPALLWRFLRPYAGAGDRGLLDLRDPGPALAWARTLTSRRAPRLARLLGPADEA
jgi:predicted ATP-grasp superfamily ATP-dependent carboligase